MNPTPTDEKRETETKQDGLKGNQRGAFGIYLCRSVAGAKAEDETPSHQLPTTIRREAEKELKSVQARLLRGRPRSLCTYAQSPARTCAWSPERERHGVQNGLHLQRKAPVLPADKGEAPWLNAALSSCPPQLCASPKTHGDTHGDTHAYGLRSKKASGGRRHLPPGVSVTQPMIIRLIQSLLSSAAQGSSGGGKFIPLTSVRPVDETGTAGGLASVTTGKGWTGTIGGTWAAVQLLAT